MLMCVLRHSGGVDVAQPPAIGCYPFRMQIRRRIPQQPAFVDWQ